jgi:hypothetical protein
MIRAIAAVPAIDGIGTHRLLNPQQHLAIIQQNRALPPPLMSSATGVPGKNSFVLNDLYPPAQSCLAAMARRAIWHRAC